MNQQFRYGENDIFSKRSKRWRDFSPAGLSMIAQYREFLASSAILSNRWKDRSW